MASNKEIRRLIKAARTAYDKGNYEEAIKECQAVFWLEEDHYLSHVITGKAYLQLKDRQNSLTHYRKAKSCDQNELLAWKGLVDLYDNYPPQDDTERLEAIESYERVLNNVSDGEREMTIISKLADLHMRLKQFDKATNYFISLLLSPSHQVSSLRYLLSHPHHSLSQWPLIRDTYNSLAVTMETPLRLEIKKLFLSSSIVWIKLLEDRNIELFDGLREVCSLDGDHDEIHVLLQLALWDSIYDFNVSNKCFPSHHLEPLNEQLSHEKEGQGAWFPCHCISLLLSKKLKDVISLIAENEPTTCEGHLVSCVCHMMSHDYATTISEARTGLSMLDELPLFLRPKVKLFLNSLLAEAYLWTKATDNVATSLSLTQEMCLEWSHDCHVTWLHVRALIANAHFQSIDKILPDCPLNEDVSIVIQAELHMMKTDYRTAIEKLHSLSTLPSNGYYHYLLGYCLWMNGSRQDSYPVLIKSAQLDPYNPYCYLYLGHYHSLVSSDKIRAIKCYQKSFSIFPNLVESAMSLAECLAETGKEEAAIEVYTKITRTALPAESNEAWLRLGLHHRGCGSYDEAIKCFLKILHHDSLDSNVWECLGEAYLARGSHTSAMKIFNKALELSPSSIYSQHQVATIQLVLGELMEAVTSYGKVLDQQETYVPSLKGRAECYYELAIKSIHQVFDDNAVHFINLALQDLAKAVAIQPSFVSLWKLIGDCCLSLRCVADDHVARLTVPAALLGNQDAGSGHVTKEGLLHIGTWAYGRGLSLCDGDSPHLLHNLSAVYYHLAKLLLKNEKVSFAIQKMKLSLKIMKKAVSMSPNDHTHWTALGVIAAHNLLKSHSLSQHSFIKSIQIHPNNVVAWTNLGALYLITDNVQLAHSCFERGQSCDPAHSCAWVGDGLVAEIIGKERDAQAFFQRVSELQYHDEAAIGYAYWVCQAVSEFDRERLASLQTRESFRQKFLSARDVVLKYCRRHPDHAHGLNYLGLLYEMEGLGGPAERAIRRSLSCVPPQYQSMVLVNHARILKFAGLDREAVDVYQSLVATGTILATPTHALALFDVDRLLEAKSAYQKLLEPSSSYHRPDVLTAIAMCTFAEKDYNQCKQDLFKVFQTPPPSLHGLISLASFGGYSNDVTLLQATLTEILKLIGLNGSKSVHPSCLSALHSIKAACTSSEEINELIKQILEKLETNELIKKPLMSQVFTSLLAQTVPDSLTLVQKLLHLHPDYKWVWSFVPYFLLLLGDGRNDIAGAYLRFVIDKIKDDRNANENHLSDWCKLILSTI